MTTTTHSHKHWTDKGGHVSTCPIRMVSALRPCQGSGHAPDSRAPDSRASENGEGVRVQRIKLDSLGRFGTTGGAFYTVFYTVIHHL